MKVVEIFKSIEGEGKRTGLPCTFIRLVGCNLRCNYCDTKYSYNEDSSTKTMTPEDIVQKVKDLGTKTVTITGGEPLMHDDIEILVDQLLLADFKVNIETNGSFNIYSFLRSLRMMKCRKKLDNLLFTIDYKCNGSGMSRYMHRGNFGTSELRGANVVYKFVVSNEEDLEQAKYIIDKYKLTDDAEVFISPCFNRIEPKQIVDFILKNNMNKVRVQVQLHKIIWDPDMRGV